MAAMAPPPIASTHTERESEERPRPAPITIHKDATIELVVESLAPVLGGREIVFDSSFRGWRHW